MMAICKSRLHAKCGQWVVAVLAPLFLLLQSPAALAQDNNKPVRIGVPTAVQLQVGRDTITAIKTKEKDGYVGVQIGYKDIIEKRSKQLGVQIKMLRGGHWHEYVCYERGRIIINESACGQDSYAKVKGFTTTAGQVINFYVDDKKLPNSFLYSYPVYLE
jgi:hypothetical protein